MNFLHEHPEFSVVIQKYREAQTNVPQQLVEKDYWIMHCLWGLAEQGFNFELKGGTSLSKGFSIINRFSEDLDIKIEPPASMDVKVGKNHDKPEHIEARLAFYDWLAENISIPGVTTSRDKEFDDKKGRNGGVRLEYNSVFPGLEGVKPYVLLEVGFAATVPNTPVLISSWVYDLAASANFEIADNRAKEVYCYLPEYTFVEKLSAICRKYDLESDGRVMPVNFIRHYYDIYKLLEHESVQEFIGSEPYIKLKAQLLRDRDLSKEEALNLFDADTRRRYEQEYIRTAPLYYEDSPTFNEILSRISENLELL